MLIKPVISIVLGSYNRKPFLKKVLKTIRENSISVPYEIIVIDGGSDDGSVEYLISQKDVVTIIQHNKGRWLNKKIESRSWGYYMNIGFQASHGKYIVMISDDCLLVPNSVMNSFNLFEDNLRKNIKLGGIAFYWRNLPYEKMYYVRQTLGHKLSINHGMYLKKALQEVEFCEEEKYPFYYGDGDLSLKLWHAGYSIIDCKESFVEHFHFANMQLRKKNSDNKEKHKKIYMSFWKNIFYDEQIDNQSGKIFLKFSDHKKTADLFKSIPSYHIGIVQSKLPSLYGYEKERPERLPSVEMLSNDLNIKYITSKFKIKRNQLCIFGLITKNNKILMGLREYINGSPVWTFPGGRMDEEKTLIETLGREIEEEIGITDIKYIKTIGQKFGVKNTDRVYFVECETNEEPQLMEPEKFKSWKWFSKDELPVNLMSVDDIKFIDRVLNK